MSMRVVRFSRQGEWRGQRAGLVRPWRAGDETCRGRGQTDKHGSHPVGGRGWGREAEVRTVHIHTCTSL